MAVRVVADAMAGGAPLRQNTRAVRVVHILADGEQKGACLSQMLQQTRFRLDPAIFGDDLPADVIHGDGDPGPDLRDEWSDRESQRFAAGDAHLRFDRTTPGGRTRRQLRGPFARC